MSKPQVMAKNVSVTPNLQPTEASRARLLRRPISLRGILPNPDHDPIFYCGRTIANLNFFDCYVGSGESWQVSDMPAIDALLSPAMSDSGALNTFSQCGGSSLRGP
jgi:hypothetical protein